MYVDKRGMRNARRFRLAKVLAQFASESRRRRDLRLTKNGPMKLRSVFSPPPSLTTINLFSRHISPRTRFTLRAYVILLYRFPNSSLYVQFIAPTNMCVRGGKLHGLIYIRQFLITQKNPRNLTLKNVFLPPEISLQNYVFLDDFRVEKMKLVLQKCSVLMVRLRISFLFCFFDEMSGRLDDGFFHEAKLTVRL